MKRRMTLLLISAFALAVVSGCMGQYPNNPQLSALYKMLNYETTLKEKTLFFEMEPYKQLVSNGEFYITGAGISTPGPYTCSDKETVLSAIEKAGQNGSFSTLSYTLVRGIGKEEREISGMALLMGDQQPLDVQPGDLLCVETAPEAVALSQK